MDVPVGYSGCGRVRDIVRV